jgi:type I restriction enzyme S subunit
MVPNSWSTTTIGEIADLGSGSTPSRQKQAEYFDGGTIRWVKTGDLNNCTILDTEESITSQALKESSCKVYPTGTLLIAMYGGFKQIGRTGLLGCNAAINQALTAISLDRKRAIPEYVQHWLNHRVFVWRRLAGSSRKDPNITKSEVSAFPLLLPPINEQVAIASVLSTWDHGITQLADVITVKLSSREGLVRRLLSGILRFQEFSKNIHEQVPLNQVLEKASESVILSAPEMYREIGVRSHGKGIFHKEPVSGESLGNKRVYHVVPGCLTLNIVFAWERAVAITTEREDGMIASHRFPMFRPNPDRLLAEYALLYLLSKKGSEALELASPGGAGRNRTLSQTGFLKNLIPLPSVAEQRRIVTFVQTADREIDLLRKQLEALKKQKKGLMQKLLSGEVRVSLPKGVA